MRNIDVDRWWISPGRDESMTGDIWEGYIQCIERCVYPTLGFAATSSIAVARERRESATRRKRGVVC